MTHYEGIYEYCFTCKMVTASFLSEVMWDGHNIPCLRCSRCKTHKTQIKLYEVKDEKEKETHDTIH